MRKRSLCPSNGDLEEVKDIMNHDYVIKQEAWMEEGILVNIQNMRSNLVIFHIFLILAMLLNARCSELL